MATVTGNVSDFTGGSMYDVAAEVFFVPSEPSLYDRSILATRPPSVVPDASGNFTKNLVPNTLTRPLTHYVLRVRWLDSANQFHDQDYPDWKIRVPIEGGRLVDMVITRPGAYQTFVGSEPPKELEDNLWWLNPDTADLNEWSVALNDWTYRGNLRGPRGLPATGAAEDDAAIAEFAGTPGTETNTALLDLVSDALGEDVMDYSFNVSEATLGKFRQARDAAAGAGTCRIAVHGDSSPWGSGSGNAHLTSAYPGRLQRRFEEVYGKEGTGFMPMLRNYEHAGMASEQPWLQFSQTGVSESDFGVYQLGSKKITKNGTDSWVQLERVFGDVFRLFFVSSPGLTAKVIVDGVDVGNVKTNTGAGATSFPRIGGYATRLVVTDVPTAYKGYHSIRIIPEGADGAEVHLVGIECYTSPSRGVVVSNVALSGITTNHLVVDDVTLGQYGMSVGFDAVRAHLNIIHIGTNDWQQHLSVAGFKARLATAVRRAKASAPVANGGQPASSNVLLVVNQWVDTASFPADHINEPANDLYMQAVREVAVEETVAGMDLRRMTSSFAEWNAKGYAADGLHPSVAGHEVISSVLFRLLSRPKY